MPVRWPAAVPGSTEAVENSLFLWTAPFQKRLSRNNQLQDRHVNCLQDLDGGFVGYPCVDLSSLNTGPGQFKDSSTATGKGYANMLQAMCCERSLKMKVKVGLLRSTWQVVDKCGRLAFLGVENSGNMWHKRREDHFERPIDIQDMAFRERGTV